MSSACVNWFFGRGLSICCGLTWRVPDKWRELDREVQIRKIRAAIRTAMNDPSVNTGPIRRWLSLIGERTTPRWSHRLITTNWDYLLQKEVSGQGWTVKPDWLENSHVNHLNGTIEELPNNGHRSPFLLESDPPEERRSTIEANLTFEKIIWDRHFVVVGMSFECEMDKFLLQALGAVQDDLPIGESRWLVVNSNVGAAEVAAARIQGVLPNARVEPVLMGFEEWLADGALQLRSWGAFSG